MRYYTRGIDSIFVEEKKSSFTYRGQAVVCPAAWHLFSFINYAWFNQGDQAEHKQESNKHDQ